MLHTTDRAARPLSRGRQQMAPFTVQDYNLVVETAISNYAAGYVWTCRNLMAR